MAVWNTEVCERCHQKSGITIMSKFNTDILCVFCKTDERKAPNYEKADAAETRAVLDGVANFPGIGLAQEDRDFLAKLRQQRATPQSGG